MKHLITIILLLAAMPIWAQNAVDLDSASTEQSLQSRINDADDTPPPIPKRRAKASAPKPAARRTTAAPRKAATAKESTPPPMPSRTSRTPAKPRPAAKRKPSQPSPRQPMSKAGCVLTTICITAGFFLLYTLVGLIFDKM